MASRMRPSLGVVMPASCASVARTALLRGFASVPTRFEHSQAGRLTVVPLAPATPVAQAFTGQLAFKGKVCLALGR